MRVIDPGAVEPEKKRVLVELTGREVAVIQRALYHDSPRSAPLGEENAVLHGAFTDLRTDLGVLPLI